MTDFDWTTWIDQNRQAAERRAGSTDTDAVLDDPGYSAALEVWSRWQRAQEALVKAQQDAAAAVADARALGV